MFDRLNKMLLENRFWLHWNLFKRYIFHRFFSTYVPYYPTTIELEVTTKCNLNCPGCERTLMPTEFKNYDAPFEYFERISPLFSHLLSVSLVGLGESLLHPQLWKIIKFIKSFGTHVAYTSNGMLLNEENINKTFEAGTDKVVISLDGATENVYKKIRPQASFNQVVENIKKICQIKRLSQSKLPCICLGFTIQTSNIEEMPQFVKLAHQLGVDEIWFTGFRTHNKETLDESPCFLSPEYAGRIFDLTKETACRLGISIRLPNLWTPELFRKKAICPVLWNSTFIFCDGKNGVGKVRFCRHFRMQKSFICTIDGKLVQKELNYPSTLVGNAMQVPILKIWNNKKYRILRKDMKFGPFTDPCKTCWDRFGVH